MGKARSACPSFFSKEFFTPRLLTFNALHQISVQCRRKNFPDSCPEVLHICLGENSQIICQDQPDFFLPPSSLIKKRLRSGREVKTQIVCTIFREARAVPVESE
jgi:hypothetical protein